MALVAMTALPLFAQTTSGTVSGTVKDPQGRERTVKYRLAE